jgi:hypothetical protein
MRRNVIGYVGLGSLVVGALACNDFDTKRSPPPRGTVGEEVFGVLCDRIGAQSLREDMTGASFRDVCHKKADGTYAEAVDEAKLPAVTSEGRDEKGGVVSVEQRKQNRARDIGRIAALARRRADLIAAIDYTIPDVDVGVKDTKNPDGTKSCDAPKKNGEAPLPQEVADMLGRFIDLYNDGTIPQSTQSLGKVITTFRDNPEAQKAWARFDSRKGYRPSELALGAARPMVAYPRLRDLANATLKVMSADANVYDPDPKRDENGNRVPVPGAAYGQFTKLLETASLELQDAKADPPPGPLAFTADAQNDRVLLSRPRSNLEVMQRLFLVSDDRLGGGAKRFIVKRDVRGYAALSGGKVFAPFVDQDGDGLPDVDDLGIFKTNDGKVAPAPFAFFNGPEVPRDAQGFALVSGKPAYEYIDSTHTFAAQMMLDMRPLVNPKPEANHETMMDALAGLYVMMGTRDGGYKTARTYKAGTLQYDQFKGDTSPLLDLVYAVLQILGDPTIDDTLKMTKTLMADKQADTARLVGGLLAARDVANAHPEAKIPAKAMFWDETLDVLAKIAKEPGLLEDLLRAMADPASAELGKVYGNYAKFRDEVSYDRNNLNGPAFNVTKGNASEMGTPVDRSKAATGQNRSALQRFLSMIVDTVGVTSCNKDGAVAHATLFGLNVTLPLVGTYKECEVFKIENMAAFYLDAIVNDPKGQLWIRDSLMRNGVAGLGAASVDLMEQSSGITGFWTPGNSTVLQPKPEWLNRLVFFDTVGDSKNQKTFKFLNDLNGTYIGSAVCPERVIDDPCRGNSSCGEKANVSPDGKVHGLRNCADGDWIQQRGKNTIFVWENFGFYRAMTPMLRAFTSHDREDLFLELASIANKHYADDKATPSECRIGPGKACPRTGAVSYEPLLAEMFVTDMLPALSNVSKVLDQMKVNHCDAIDPKTKACTKVTPLSGIDVAARAARAALDPDLAKQTGLKDRRGDARGKRNDGTFTTQVTPAYLIANALSAIDDSFEQYALTHPEDKERQAQWRRARSQLVDQFLKVDGTGSGAKFSNPGLPVMTPSIVEVVRSQLAAHCPNTFTPPYERCTWAREELVKKMNDTVKGPTFAGMLDLADAIRKDPEARRELESLMDYLLNQASRNDALPAMVASMNDMVQILDDDTNIVPFYKVMAAAAAPSKRDESGKVVDIGLVDAQTALLAKISGKAFDKEGRQICSRELDPNQILSIMLQNLVTPMPGPQKGKPGQTPLEVIVDVVADVNKSSPDKVQEKLTQEDYRVISDNVQDFLLNKERGMEQFYEVIRQGTIK